MDAAWWENRYVIGDTPWDHRAPHPALIARLSSDPPPPSLRVLVPGCGTGHDARAWAAVGAQVTGLDLAPSALAIARAHPTPQPIQWVEGSIFDPPSQLRHAFDLVFEHTCFCAIHPDRRPDYVRGVRDCLSSGGRFFGIFYLKIGRENGPPFGVAPTSLDDLFAPHFTLLERFPPVVTYPGREGREEIRLLAAR